MADPKPLRLTLRRAALLHAIRFGCPPWWKHTEEDRQYGLDRARERDRKDGCGWVLCCGHVYSTSEIEAMVAAGWVVIAEGPDRFGRPCRYTAAGPKIADAWQWPHYV